MRRAAVVLVLGLLGLFALSGCGGDETATPAASQGEGVKELTNVLSLRSDFEADAGKTRVLLLFSPT